MPTTSRNHVLAHKFLNTKSTLLKLLPPTQNAFFNHLKRAAFATAVDKSAHIHKPQLPSYEENGWALNAGKLVPVTSTFPAWPESMTKTIACGCMKGCKKNCSCMKKNISCYIECRCRGTVENCSRMQHAEAIFSDVQHSL